MVLEFHPLAHIFPMLDDDELKTLAEDIKDKGLTEPITLYEGKVLDGRNRYRACGFPDVELSPEYFKQYEGYPSGVGRSAACLLNVPVLGLHGVEDTVGSERFDRIDEIEAAMEAEPFSGVAMPLDVEAVGADPV